LRGHGAACNRFFQIEPKPGENTHLFPLHGSGHFLTSVRDVDVFFFQISQSRTHP
jgi:hypothetical protein